METIVFSVVIKEAGHLHKCWSRWLKRPLHQTSGDNHHIGLHRRLVHTLTKMGVRIFTSAFPEQTIAKLDFAFEVG